MSPTEILAISSDVSGPTFTRDKLLRFGHALISQSLATGDYRCAHSWN